MSYQQGLLSSQPFDPIPFLLTLHSRSLEGLPPAEIKRLRDSMLATSFGRGWQLIHAAHRKHPHQEVRLSPATHTHLILHYGKPLQLQIGFGGKANKKMATRGSVTLIPQDASTDWLWEPYGGEESEPRAELLHLYLDRDTFAQVATEMGDTVVVDALRETVAAKDPVLWRLGETIREEMNSAAVGSRLYADAAAVQLAVHLLRHYRAGDRKRGADRAERAALLPSRLHRVTEYLEENLHRDILLTEVAGVAGVSLYHFARLFKNATGYAPHQYLVLRRVERAKTLLTTTRFPIAQVALLVGFESHSRFSAQFRRVVGVTPAEYRNKS